MTLTMLSPFQRLGGTSLQLNLAIGRSILASALDAVGWAGDLMAARSSDDVSRIWLRHTQRQGSLLAERQAAFDAAAAELFPLWRGGTLRADAGPAIASRAPGDEGFIADSNALVQRLME